MRLDQIIPRTGVPAAAPYQQASPSIFAAPTEVAAEALNRVSASSLKGLDAVQAAEDAKTLVRVRTEANRVEAEVEGELDKLDSALKFSETDPEAFQQKRAEGVKQIKDSLKTRVKFPESMVLLDQRLPAIYRRYDKSAATHADALIKGDLDANLETTLDTYRQLAGNIPLNDDPAFADVYGRAAKAAEDSALWRGKKAAQERVIKLRGDLIGERARRAADADPEGFLRDATETRRFDGIDPTRRDMLVERAERRVDALKKQADAELEKFYKRAEEDEKRERQAQVDALDSAAERGELTRTQLEDARRMRIATGEDYRRLSRLLDKPEKPEKEEPSDPDTLRRFTIDVHSSRPQTKESELRAAMQPGGGLNVKDGRMLLDRLRETTRQAEADARTVRNEVKAQDTLARVLENQDHSRKMQEHQQAEQELFKGLGIVGPLSQLDKVQEKLVPLALMALRRRSYAYPSTGGKENPLTVVEEILPQFQAAMASDTRMRIDQIKPILKFATPQELEAAWAAGKISAGEFTNQKKLFIEWDRAEKEAAAARERMEAAKAKAGPKGYRQPSGVMGR